MNTSGHLATSLIASVFAVALVTTLVLPGRQTGTVATAGFKGLSGLVSASLGK